MLTIREKRSAIAKADAPVIRDVAFARDVLEGLTSEPKHLHSKYFYDKEGDQLFQQIMSCEEYYPFQCELEIFTQQTDVLAQIITKADARFDLIELGAGDCTKTSYLLTRLVNIGADFTYLPIDISENIIDYLNDNLPLNIPGLQVNGLNGDYFEMLAQACKHSDRRKSSTVPGIEHRKHVSRRCRRLCSRVEKPAEARRSGHYWHRSEKTSRRDTGCIQRQGEDHQGV